MANSLESACQRLRNVPSSEVERWRSSGRKADFFRALQAATLPYSLTGAVHNEPHPDEKIRSDPRSASRTSSAKGVRVHVVGDSIARELAQALMKLVSDDPTVNTTYGLNNVPTTLQDATMKWANQWGRPVLGELEGCSLDVLFLGGYGPWALRRFDRHPVPASVAKSPLLHHEAFMTHEVKLMQCVARRTDTPLVFIGSLPIEGRTIHLDPPKQDWHKFYDFGLATAMAEIEERVFRRLVGTRQVGTGMAAAAAAATAAATTQASDLPASSDGDDPSPASPSGSGAAAHPRHDPRLPPAGGDVLMLNLRALAESCPMVRCDGMHFASDYTQFGCHASMAAWYPFLLRFLQRSGLVDPATRRWRPRPSPCAKARRGATAEQRPRILSHGTFSEIFVAPFTIVL